MLPIKYSTCPTLGMVGVGVKWNGDMVHLWTYIPQPKEQALRSNKYCSITKAASNDCSIPLNEEYSVLQANG
jgi:hypothetical protein